MFGGLAVRNTQVSDGGVARHRIRNNLVSCAKSGVKFINISPLRSDAMAELEAEWLPPVPGSDTAIMLGLAHTLLSNGLHDVEFLRTYTTGFDKFAAYLTDATDGVVKDPAHGFIITLAAGGLYTELLQDRVSVLLQRKQQIR